MEKKNRKAKIEPQFAFKCCFCKTDMIFNRKEDLEFHLLRNHLKQVLGFISKNCKTKVRLIRGKWLSV